VFNALDFGDLIPATIKVSFGFAIGLVGCFKGYYCKKGTAGLVAANSAVVYTSMLLFIIDFIAVLLLYFMIYN
jgi:phospholipid/cholesterol/gamma-HCH transport system permease protein